MPLRRTLLFVPANRERMLQRAPTAGADAVVIDLEDAVPAGEKKTARRAARASLKTFDGIGVEVFVRVNGIASGATRDDLLAVVRKGLAGVVLPKAEHPQDVRDLDVLLREAEMANKVRPGDIAVIPLIESPRALLRCELIAQASDRIIALSLGGEDYSAAMGIARDAAGVGLAHARYVLATIASAYGMAAVDTPYTGITDAKGLETETKLAKAIGFSGKYLIHPGHVAAVNRIFAPSRPEIADARRIIAAAGEAAASGAGSASVNGRMVDAPIVQRARDLLARADALKPSRRLS
jgi:citrate lyase subunit beta/citryl-CoA lyase